MITFDEVAQRVIRERKLNPTIDRAMPEHVATAAGYYSVETDTVHVNMSMLGHALTISGTPHPRPDHEETSLDFN